VEERPDAGAAVMERPLVAAVSALEQAAEVGARRGAAAERPALVRHRHRHQTKPAASPIPGHDSSSHSPSHPTDACLRAHQRR
jgi:hypothetical protein